MTSKFQAQRRSASAANHKKGKSVCEVLEAEMSKQCCICRGGHDCLSWELCEACQDLDSGNWPTEEIGQNE